MGAMCGLGGFPQGPWEEIHDGIKPGRWMGELN